MTPSEKVEAEKKLEAAYAPQYNIDFLIQIVNIYEWVPSLIPVAVGTLLATACY